jgi:ribonuclease-3
MSDTEVSPQTQQKIFNPWNPKNKNISSDTILSILSSYGLTVELKKQELFQLACVHKSYVDRSEVWEKKGEKMTMTERPPNCLPLKEADNEELEFIGDGFVGNIIGLYLAKRYKGEGEGFFTRIRTRIVNNKQLGELSIAIGLAPYLIISRHVEDVCKGRENLEILGSLFESWLGALFQHEEERIGEGWNAVRTFLLAVVKKHVNFRKLISNDTNYKDQLLRWFQSHYHSPPRYKEVEVVGPPHDRIFTMGVMDVDDSILAKSTARNKKIAEQEASRLALLELQKRHPETSV